MPEAGALAIPTASFRLRQFKKFCSRSWERRRDTRATKASLGRGSGVHFDFLLIADRHFA
jgi:hypothetical protein